MRKRCFSDTTYSLSSKNEEEEKEDPRKIHGLQTKRVENENTSSSTFQHDCMPEGQN